MGPTQDNFLSWWQIRMLIIGQHDKMHRDLNSKRSTELSATSMWILVSRDNEYVSNLVFFLSVYWSAWTRHKIQQGHCFIAPSATTLLADTTTT